MTCVLRGGIRSRLWIFAVALGLSSQSVSWADRPDPVSAPERLANRILEASGVEGGLVVHLGCGDGRLTAALRADARYTVHGLDADASNVEAARQHISDKGPIDFYIIH